MRTVRLSSILSALSYALDLTEGHPQGHASRTCLIGMRIARELKLSAEDQSHLFYALLLKDAGCSSNSERVYQLFGGDEQKAKRGAWMRDWRADQLDALSAETPLSREAPGRESRGHSARGARTRPGPGLCRCGSTDAGIDSALDSWPDASD